MSSNSSLSAAKRRRVGLPNQPSPLNGQGQLPSNSQQSFNSRVSSQNVNGQQRNTPQTFNKSVGNQRQVSVQPQQSSNNLGQSKNARDLSSLDENTSQSFPLLPSPPPGLTITQILSTHHMYVNKMASDFSVAIDELGNTFNDLSSNCDNLNERLSSVEGSLQSSLTKVLSNNTSNANSVSSDDYVSLKSTVQEVTDKLNSFTRDLNELKELKLIILKNQGLLMDNTLNITTVKKELSQLESLSNRLLERVSTLETRESSNQEVMSSSSNLTSGEDEFVSNHLADSLNNILLNKNTDDVENDEYAEELDGDNVSENINLSVYEN